MTISSWSSTAASNTTIDGVNIDEGCAPSGINNAIRSVMAGVRAQHENQQWIDYGHTPTRTGNTTFTLVGDQTATYTAGRRIRCTDASTIYATITSSVFGATTTVTIVNGTGNLTAALSAVAVGSDPATNRGRSTLGFLVSKLATQTITTSTFTRVSFSSETWDTGDLWNATTYRWTPPAGPVLVGGSVYVATTVADAIYTAIIYKNGSAFAGDSEQPSTTGGAVSTVQTFDIANGTDYYELFFWHNAGADATVSADSIYTRMWGTIL